MTKAKQSESITERAMIVTLNIQQWSGAKHDKRVSQEVADKHQADVSMGRYQKRLVAKEALEEMRKVTSEARHEHYERTLPWMDGGGRILSSVGYFDYAESMRKKQARWDAAVEKFMSEYPQIIQDARSRLNGLFQEKDYPRIERMRRKFAFGFSVLPMPTAQDFRVQLGDAETARVRSEIEDSVNESIRAAMTDVWDRVRTVVEHMKERLQAYSVSKEGVSNPFRDSLVTNIRDLIELLPSLNITQDAALTQFATRISKELCAYSADELRENDSAREKTAKAAEEILASMEAFV